MVLSKSVESFQVLPCLVQWVGVTSDSRRHDCRSHLGQQYVGGVFGGGGHGGQKWTDFKQYPFKVAMSLCVYHICQSLDRIENLCARSSLGGPGRVFYQDANVGFDTPVTQTVCARLPSLLCVPTRGSAMLRGLLSSSVDVKRVLDGKG